MVDHDRTEEQLDVWLAELAWVGKQGLELDHTPGPAEARWPWLTGSGLFDTLLVVFLHPANVVTLAYTEQ